MRRVLSLIRSGLPRRSQIQPPTQRPAVPDSDQRRLYLLGTAFMARGMNAQDAYNKAVHYTKGSGRRQNWISALSEEDRESGTSTACKNELSATPHRAPGDRERDPS